MENIRIHINFLCKGCLKNRVQEFVTAKPKGKLSIGCKECGFFVSINGDELKSGFTRRHRGTFLNCDLEVL